MSSLSVYDVQQAIEKALLSLRRAQFPTDVIQARDSLIPPGYRPVVRLREHNRAMKDNAPARNWSPKSGEIIIGFVAEANPQQQETQPVAERPASEPSHLDDLLQALHKAETAPGRSFVALTWFRDDWLPRAVSGWTQSKELRHEILSKAIDDEWVLAGKAPNPKTPLYPTTTIKLNRQKSPHPAVQHKSRFRPATISGEPLSATILKDRGRR